jgi:hypothetical protein
MLYGAERSLISKIACCGDDHARQIDLHYAREIENIFSLIGWFEGFCQLLEEILGNHSAHIDSVFRYGQESIGISNIRSDQTSKLERGPGVELIDMIGLLRRVSARHDSHLHPAIKKRAFDGVYATNTGHTIC